MCPKCGGHLDLVQGNKLDPSKHFEHLMYLNCRRCGFEKATRNPVPKKERKPDEKED